jgi:TolA-binding protein
MRLLIHLFIAALFFATVPVQVQAQDLSKEEIKYWKNQAKEYKRNPGALKELADEAEQARKQKREMELKLTQLEADRISNENQANQMQQEISDLNSRLIAAQNAIQQLNEEKAAMASKGAGPDMSGLVFRVQIGAYGKANIPGNLDQEGDNMDLETEGGLQKILIGRYSDYQDAETLRKHMQKIGVKDAWVVPYRDGVRISLAEAGIDVN